MSLFYSFTFNNRKLFDVTISVARMAVDGLTKKTARIPAVFLLNY
ncbi:hypothetical protein [Brevibacillus daliensis]|nr:hypothetical protein [Brevibacillus daliensis]